MSDLLEDVLRLVFRHFEPAEYAALPGNARDVLSFEIGADDEHISRLRNYALVNRTWNRTAENVLYRTLFIRPRRVFAIDALLEGLIREPNRAKQVRRLRIRAIRKDSEDGPRGPCSRSLIRAVESLPISSTAQTRLITSLCTGKWDARYVLLLCLCPNVEAFQLRDFDFSKDTVIFDILAESARFGRSPADIASQSCVITTSSFLWNLRFVRIGWKERRRDWFGGSVVARSKDGAWLVTPFMNDHTALSMVLRYLPRMCRLSFYQYHDSKRPRTVHARQSREDYVAACNIALTLSTGLYGRNSSHTGLLHSCARTASTRKIARSFRSHLVLPILSTQGRHIEELRFLSSHNFFPSPMRGLDDLRPIQHLKHLDVSRDLLYSLCQGGRLELILPTSLQSLRIRGARNYSRLLHHRPAFAGSSLARSEVAEYVKDEDQKIVALMHDREHCLLGSVEVEFEKNLSKCENLPHDIWIRGTAFNTLARDAGWRFTLSVRSFHLSRGPSVETVSAVADDSEWEEIIWQHAGNTPVSTSVDIGVHQHARPRGRCST